MIGALRSILFVSCNRLSLSRLPVHDGSAGLVVGEDEGVGDDDVLPPRGGEDDDLGDVVGRQRLATPGSKRISTAIIHAKQ